MVRRAVACGELTSVDEDALADAPMGGWSGRAEAVPVALCTPVGAGRARDHGLDSSARAPLTQRVMP
jgi:hypothetical protein